MSDHFYFNHDHSFEVTIEVETDIENFSSFSTPHPQMLDNADGKKQIILEMTFEEIFSRMYYSDKPLKFEQLQESLEDTIDQVNDSHHLEFMIQSNISEYSLIVKQDVQKAIVQLRRYQQKKIGYLEVIEKIFNSQCCIEEIGKEVDKVVQLYQTIESNSFSLSVRNFIRNHSRIQFITTKQLKYNYENMKDFLDQVTANVTDKDEVQHPNKTQIAQLTQNYSILLKQQTNQQQRQLPKPTRSPKEQPKVIDSDQKIPYASFMKSRFTFPSGGGGSNEEFFNIIQNEKNEEDPKNSQDLRAQFSSFYDPHSYYNSKLSFQAGSISQNSSQQTIQVKKKRNKKCKQDPGQYHDGQQSKNSDSCRTPQAKERTTPCHNDSLDFDDSRTKPKDEIKEFERRLDAVHETLRNDQKLPLNVSKEWIKKMQQMHQKTLKQARAQRN